MSYGEKISKARSQRGLAVTELANLLGIPKDRIYKWEKGLAEPKHDDRVKLDAWLNGKTSTNQDLNTTKVIPDRNARALGLPADLHVTKAGISYIETTEGYFIMYAPHVTERARAGFQGGGFGDPVYIESLPKYPMVVKTIHKGNYFVFDVTGDSMNDGTLKSIPDKSKVLGREIKLDLWRSKFHYNEFPYFIIVHKEHGVLCKEIIAHDIEKATIVLRSLNPNKTMYADFTVSLNDCLMICNIVKKEIDAN